MSDIWSVRWNRRENARAPAKVNKASAAPFSLESKHTLNNKRKLRLQLPLIRIPRLVVRPRLLSNILTI